MNVTNKKADLGGLGHAGEDGKCARLDARLNHLGVDVRDLPDKAVLFLVKVLGGKVTAWKLRQKK